MPCPKGFKRGPMSAEHRAKISAANTIGQKRRWADPEKRIRALSGCTKSWATGGRAQDRVVWTEAMDAELARVVAEHPWPLIRDVAAERIGVCDRAVIQRIKALNLASVAEARRRKALDDKATQAADLRRKHFEWRAIAKMVGYSGASSASIAVLRRHPELKHAVPRKLARRTEHLCKRHTVVKIGAALICKQKEADDYVAQLLAAD